MKNLLIIVILLLVSIQANAQVGIGNTNPKAKLDVTASNVATPANTDGILIPRIDNFPATNPTADQNGMLLFVTGNGTPSKGFYYWDNASTSWISVIGAKKINDLTDGKSDNDGTQNGSSLFLGRNAGANDDSTDNKNVGIGFQSLNANTTGDFNTATGYRSLNSNDTGSSNTATGAGALFSNTTGNKNVALGNRAGYNETGSNKLYIENSDADPDNALIYGEFGTDNTTTGNILRTNSQFQIGNPTGSGYAFPTTDGTPNQIMQTDGAGQISFVNPSSVFSDDADWFAEGTTTAPSDINDNIYTNGNVGIGTTTPNPNAALDVVSANKGFLPPRVANVAAIASPVAGLLIYDESNQCMRYYNGSIWSDLPLPHLVELLLQ